MRPWLQRSLGPRVEALFDRIERSVTREDHVARVERIVADPRLPQALPEAARALASSLLDEGRRLLEGEAPRSPAPGAERGLAERLRAAGGGDGELLHLAGLLRLPDGRSAPSAPRPVVAGPETIPPARELALLNARLAAEGPTDALVSEAVDRACGLPPRRWFLLRGAHRGTGHLLLALLRLAPGPLDPYTREVCDRLIRHLEIRKRQALAFRGEEPAAGLDVVERLRFAIALVVASRAFGDLRYLNTALKLNDWQLGALDAKAPREARALAAIHYVVSIARQEAAMREHVGT